VKKAGRRAESAAKSSYGQPGATAAQGLDKGQASINDPILSTH
jgi:hypothetical protein